MMHRGTGVYRTRKPKKREMEYEAKREPKNDPEREELREMFGTETEWVREADERSGDHN